MHDARSLRLSTGMAARIVLMTIVIVFLVTLLMAFVALLTSEASRTMPLSYGGLGSVLAIGVLVGVMPGAILGPIAGVAVLVIIARTRRALSRAQWVKRGVLSGLCAGALGVGGAMAFYAPRPGLDDILPLTLLGCLAGALSGALVGLYVGRLARMTTRG